MRKSSVLILTNRGLVMTLILVLTAVSGTDSRFPVARPQSKVQFKHGRGSEHGNHLQLTEAS